MVRVPINFEGYIQAFTMTHGTISTHTHDFLEFVYILDGRAKHRLGGTVSTVGAGDFFVVNYQTAHEYDVLEGELLLVNCMFLPESLDRTFAGIRNFNELVQRYFLRVCGKHILMPPSDTVFHDSDDTVRSVFLQMVKECSEKSAGYEEVLRCLLSRVVIETVRRVGSGISVSTPVRKLMDAVDREYTKKLSLTELCETMHYTLPYVSALFRKEAGMTFTEYLQSKRIAESCRLLEETRESVTAIACKVGYGEAKFFNQVFQRVMGMSAKDYRRHVHKQKNNA